MSDLLAEMPSLKFPKLFRLLMLLASMLKLMFLKKAGVVTLLKFGSFRFRCFLRHPLRCLTHRRPVVSLSNHLVVSLSNHFPPNSRGPAEECRTYLLGMRHQPHSRHPQQSSNTSAFCHIRQIM